MSRPGDETKGVGKGRGPDHGQIPRPSENQQRFMVLMSGDTMGRRDAANQNGEASTSCEDDPAFAVGVAMFFWRFSRRGMPMPKRAMRLLERHASAGDPACILVRDWLRARMAKSVGPHGRPLWVFDGGRKG